MANQQATLTSIPLKASVNLNKIECDIKPYTGFHDDNALFIGGVKNNLYKKSFWDGKTDGGKVFICHKDNKNYYGVNQGINNIAVIEENLESGESELVALFDNAKKFVKKEEGDYKESQSVTISDSLEVNWVCQSGMVTVNVTNTESETRSFSFDSKCRNVKVSMIANTGLLFSVYDIYSAKKVSEVKNVIYRFSDSSFYVNSDTSFIWPSEQDLSFADNTFLYVQYEPSGLKTGITTLTTSNLNGYLHFEERTFSIKDCTVFNTTSLISTSGANVTALAEPIIRSNGLGIEVGIRRSSDKFGGITEDAYVYYNRNGALLTEEMGEDFKFLSIAGDKNYGLWEGGLQEHINGDFDVTFYSGVPFCITSRRNRIKVEHNIDEILWEECDESAVYYTFENKKYKLSIEEQQSGEIEFQVINDYIFFNVDCNRNTVRLSDGKSFNRSDDYICLAIPYLRNDVTNDFISNEVYSMYATGYHVLYSRDNYSDIGMVLAPLTVKKAFTSDKYSYYLPEGYENDIMTFWGETDKDSTALVVPTYYTTLRNGYNSDYENVYYPINSSNVVYNPSILDKIEDSYFDEYLFNDGQYSYVSTRTQNQSIVLGYYIQTLAEFNKMFIIAGTHYAIQGNYIIRLDISNGQVSGVSPLAYIGDFEYIGATVTEAIFWSPIDKSFYLFKGDLTLTKFIESNRINKIYSTFSQPSLSCVVCATNDGILFFYGDQMIRLPIETEGRIYYTNHSFIIDNYEYCFLKRDGYEKEPIIIETEFYSSASYVEETNDCLYITLFDEEPSKGKVELSCMTLKEGQFKSERKIFDISPSMFDKSQGYLRLRYQPQYQTGAFSFKIVSDFSIANLAISHRVNNVGNSRYND